ncbi:MAG: phage tail tape measure protein, partial [Anaerotardibacter sp.]
MAKDEIKVKFRAETADMNAAIKASNNELKQLRSEMKLNEAQMKNSGSSADTLKQRHQILANQLEQNKAKQEALSQKIEVAKKFYGENSDEVNKLKTSLNYAKIEEEQIKAKIEETNNALKNQSNRAEEAANKLDKVGNDLTKAGKSASIMSAGIVAAGKGAVDAFSEVEKGADAVVTATGATGEAAEELIDVYENVAGSVVGSFESIGGAVGEVNTRFGFVGEELETCSNKFIKFADITGTDAVKAVQDVSRYMGDAGIASSEYGSVLDQLAVAAQASGIQVDKLAESCTKYGAPMRALGFDTKESIAIFASWEKAGVNTETAFSGMKKAISNWSAAGKDARVEFKATLDEIAKCPDIASATTKAIEVFGSKAGPDLADAIQGGRFEYEEMLALIENSEGVLESTYEEWENGTQKTDKALQNLKLAASGVGESIMNTLTPAIEWGSNALSGFADWWEGLGSGMQTAILVVAGVVAAIGPMLIIIGQMSIGLGSVVDFTSKFSGNLGFVKKALGLLAGPVGIVVAAIVALAAAFKWGYDNVEPFRNAVDQLWGALSQAFGPIVEMIGTELMGAFTDLCNFVSENAPGAFQAFADFIMNYIVPAVSNFGSFLNDFV